MPVSQATTTEYVHIIEESPLAKSGRLPLLLGIRYA